MQDDQIDKNLHEETRSKYLRLEEELLKELAKVKAILADLGEDPEEEVSAAGVVPPIFDIQQYLEERGEPCLQYDIIKTVGDRRKQAYPHLRHPYGDVWKSLEYHNRYDREVVCVEKSGGKIVRGTLKPKPRIPRIKGGGIDRADFYRTPDNLFWFRDRK